MLNNKTLRNILKKDFQDFFKEQGIKNAVKLTRGVAGDRNDYTNTIRLLRAELKDPDSAIDEISLNNFLKQKFFYENNSFHFIYNIASFFNNNSEIRLTEIEQLLNNPDFKFQHNLINTRYTNEYKLICTEVSTIEKDGIEYVTSVQFLIFIDEIELNKVKINFHCTVDLDLNNMFASFKFDQNLYENYSEKNIVVNYIADLIQDPNGIFSPFNINLTTHNQTAVKNAIQGLFVELSEQAEELLINETPDNVDKKIKDFLNDLDIELDDEYVKQIIAVIYQDISKSFESTLFDDGWAFRFVFNEGNNTRASSSNDDFKPVYSKQVYWNLKELMFKKNGTDFVEAGLLWHIDGEKNPVSVRLQQRNNLLNVLYYKRQKHNFIMRREKESYVLQKIRKALPRK